MIAPVPVPHHYLGVWQRTFLQSAAGVDKSSRVYWLQTPVLHADIRIPADRPAFKDKQSLLDFSLSELHQLVGQKGFAGETSVIGSSCLWLRHIDYQPPGTGHDIGNMEFSGTQILETGLAKNYSEIWERLPDSQGATYAFQFSEENSAYPAQPQSGVLVVSGDYFIFARDRATALPQSFSLEALLNEKEYTRPQLIELLDFEVSFGHIANGNIPWEILLSTLPFREGKPLITASTWADLVRAKGEYVQHDSAWNGTLTRRWLLPDAGA
jgi:hypothetical protein